jgi:ADP-ribose pyrophosphatase
MKITSSKQVYDCGLFRVTEDVAVDPKTKFRIKRSVVRHIGSAVMMAVDEKKRVLLVRQYRLPADKSCRRDDSTPARSPYRRPNAN